MSLDTKAKLHLSISVNLALWNYESWSGSMMDLKLLDTFHDKTACRALKISMAQAKEERLKNETLRKMFCNIEPLSTTWRKRVLKFVGRTTLQPQTALPRQCLPCFVLGKRRAGHPSRATKYLLIESIRLLMLSVPHSRNYQH